MYKNAPFIILLTVLCVGFSCGGIRDEADPTLSSDNTGGEVMIMPPTQTPFPLDPTRAPTPTKSAKRNVDKPPLYLTATSIPVEDTTSTIDLSEMFLDHYPRDYYEKIEVEITGKNLPPRGRLRSDPGRGLASPKIRGILLDGSTTTIGGEGPVTLVIVLAHWCPYCQKEVKELSEYIHEVGLPPDVRLLSVSTGIDKTRYNYPPHEWLKLERWPIPVLTDTPDSKIAEALGVTAFPFMVLIDDQGAVVLRLLGQIGKEGFKDIIDLVGLVEESN